MKETHTLFLFTQTPLHVGAGQSVGYVDLPIQREGHTRIPIIPGSSLKGVLRDQFEDQQVREKLFGHESGEKDESKFRAGALLIGEARVLCFPVRSAKMAFVWITCPLVLKRAVRDFGLKCEVSLDVVKDDRKVIAPKDLESQGGKVVLEEYTFDRENDDNLAALEKELAGLMTDPVWQQVAGRLVIVSDGVFSHFVQAGCAVEQHVKINDETGTAEDRGLYNEETVPSETLFYGMLAAQDMGRGEGSITAEQAMKNLKQLNGTSLQIGGGETTGLGWCSVTIKS